MQKFKSYSLHLPFDSAYQRQFYFALFQTIYPHSYESCQPTGDKALKSSGEVTMREDNTSMLHHIFVARNILLQCSVVSCLLRGQFLSCLGNIAFQSIY